MLVFLSATQFYECVWGAFAPADCGWTRKNDRMSLGRDLNFGLFSSAFLFILSFEDFDDQDDVVSSLTINDPTVLEIYLS